MSDKLRALLSSIRMTSDDTRRQNTPAFPYDMVAIDLDGTLVDTVGDLHAAVARMQTALDYPVSTVESVRDWVGNGIERLVHRALTGTMEDNAHDDLFAIAMPLFKSAYDDTNGTAAVLYPDVEKGLEWLAAKHVPLVCITNKAGRFSRPLLDTLGIGGHFVHHIAGDDVAAKKPDPAALLEGARRCDVKPDRCLLIGDSVSDIRAARAAGFAAISVSYGYNHGVSVRDLDGELEPDAVIDSFSELDSVIARLNPH